MSRGGRRKHRKVKWATREHERVFGPLRSQMQEQVLLLKTKFHNGSSHKLQMGLSQLAKVKPGGPTAFGIDIALPSPLYVASFNKVPLHVQEAFFETSEKGSPETSILQKFGPIKLKNALLFLAGEHGYLIPMPHGGEAAAIFATIFGVDVTAAEVATLKSWAQEEGPPDAVKEWIALGEPGASKTHHYIKAGDVPASHLVVDWPEPKPEPNPFGDDSEPGPK